MASVAIGWQVYSVRENPLDLGLVGLAEFLPLLLLALPAGHLADRFPRRRIYAFMVVIDVVVFASRCSAVTRAGAEHVWPFFVLAFLTGVGSAFGAPAGRALTPSLVPQEILVSALAQRSIAFQLSLVVGPADRRHPVRDPAGARLRRRRSALSLVALGCVLALRSGREPGGGGRRRISTRCSPAFASSAGRRSCSARSRSTSSPCSSAAPSRCSRSSRRTSSRSGRPGSGSCARRRRSARSSRRSRSPATRSGGAPGRRCSSSSRASARAWSSSGSRARCGSRCSRSRSAARSTW